MATTIQVRALDANWDVLRGQGSANFLTDIDAVAQIIAQRLKFLQGEWFEDTSQGFPLFQKILGNPVTNTQVSLLIRSTILGTPYVSSIDTFSVSFAPSGRAFAFSATVTTAFGTLTIGTGTV
jgi:hypothetical protein